MNGLSILETTADLRGGRAQLAIDEAKGRQAGVKTKPLASIWLSIFFRFPLLVLKGIYHYCFFFFSRGLKRMEARGPPGEIVHVCGCMLGTDF